jgi:hypothetical protein
MSRDAERIDLLVRISRDLLAVLREPRARRMVEDMIASLDVEIAVGTKSADRRKPYTLSLSRHGAVLGRVTILADDVLDAESLAGSDHLYEQCGTNMSDETVELSVEEAA